MELKKIIAAWIKEARTEAGLSGDELGMRLAFELGSERGNSKANISHWETMKHSPSLEQILAIVKVTRKSLPEQIIAAMEVGDGATQGRRAFGGPAPGGPVEPAAGLATTPPLAADPVARRPGALTNADPQPAYLMLVNPPGIQMLDLFYGTDEEGRETLLDYAKTLPRVSLVRLAGNKL